MQPDLLGDSEFVAQYGASEAAPPFRCCPRFPWEQDVSLLRRQPSVRAACRLVRRRDVTDIRDGVRYAIVGRLRAAGFVVTHTPSAAIPGHVSVTRVDSWLAEQDTDFDACFAEPVWREWGDV